MKCGEFYADDLLSYCLADGARLIKVEAGCEIWSEGARVIEEKENALRKRKRRLKRRRMVMSVMTTLVVTMVVCVVAVNSFIYLKPQPAEVAQVEPSTPPASPAEPNNLITPSTPVEPTPDASPEPTATPQPTATPTATEPTPTETSTPTPDSESPVEIPATPTPTPVPDEPTPTPTPPPPPPTPPLPPPTPTPWPTPSPTPWPTPTPRLPTLTATLIPTPTPPPERPPECTDADRSRISEGLVQRFGASWRRRIEGDRRKIIAENTPRNDAALNAESDATLGEIEYQSSFFNGCVGVIVTARYVWQVRTHFNGQVKVVSVPKRKSFTCMKLGGMWLCR